MNGKFVCCADLHIRANAPINRKDDYFETAMGKFSQIVSIANKNKADIICAGDFFDHIKVSHTVVNIIIAIIKNLDGHLFLVAGQHDLPNHKKDWIEQSPIKTLLFQENVTLLGEVPIKYENSLLYGASWEDRVPVLKRKTQSRRILAIHKAITPEKPPFFLKEAISANKALDKFTYDFIISGDYHVPFVRQRKGKLLINCGPMLRQKINEAELKPSVFLLDTVTAKCKRIYLKVNPADDVFLLENVKRDNDMQFKEELTDLVEALKSKSNSPNFGQIVNVLIDETKPNQKTIDKVKRILNDAELGKT